jgi:hypothetical protein
MTTRPRVYLFMAAAVALVGDLGCAGSTPADSRPQLVTNPHFATPHGEYGISETNPVLVGGLGAPNKAQNEHLYLARLRSPSGHPVSYRRVGSCCIFPTPNPHYGDGGLLDKYEVAYDELVEPVVLYLNMYDPGEVRAPAGFILTE